jgi:glyoxylase-like metal-dependent hydrolase (beta-lactamase superfamily II)
MDYERFELVHPHYGTVNAYRLGDTLVDTGHPCSASREKLTAGLAEGRLADVERVVLTHPHIDHVGGTLTVPAATALPHTVFRGAEAVVRGFEDYVRRAREEMATISTPPEEEEPPEPDNRYFPLDITYATDDVSIERIVGPGETVRLGPYECEVVHTPGHSSLHMSLFHEPSGVMFSGDIISTNGHFMYGPVHWDIGEYKTGLKRIRERDPDRLLPGHGDPMTDPRAQVDDALAKAERAETAILEAVAAHGTLTARELAVEALGASDESVDFLANVASVYAIHLDERGLIEVERTPGVVASAE